MSTVAEPILRARGCFDPDTGIMEHDRILASTVAYMSVLLTSTF